MSDTVKLIIEIPKWEYEQACKVKDSFFYAIQVKAIQNGTPLDDVKAKIDNLDRHKENYSGVFNRPDLIDLVVNDVLHILDNIGKESEEFFDDISRI